MISFNVENNKFNFRVAGIFLDSTGKRFLTNTRNTIDYYVLPGGRVEMGEDSKASLEREIEEELGCDVEIYDLKCITENFFEYDGKNYHELQYLYVGKILSKEIEEKEGPFMGPENKDIFQWFNCEDFDNIKYTPAHLKEPIKEVFNKDYTIRHLIHRGNG